MLLFYQIKNTPLASHLVGEAYGGAFFFSPNEKRLLNVVEQSQAVGKVFSDRLRQICAVQPSAVNKSSSFTDEESETE